MDATSGESAERVLHISEEPRLEHVLALDEGGRCFKIVLKGINVGLFYAFRGVLYEAKGGRFNPLGPTDSWTFGDLILANHSGAWVLTAPTDTPLLLEIGQLKQEECLRLDQAEKITSGGPVDLKKFATRSALVLVLASGAILGLEETVGLNTLKTQVKNQAMEMVRQLHEGMGLPR